MNFSVISDLFDRAIAIDDADARDAFVSNANLDDSSRKKLQGLIAAHFRAHGLIDNPDAVAEAVNDLTDTANEGSPDQSNVREGDQLGNYKLLQLIGEGGMGYVFMADQLKPLQRRVAVKVIKTSGSSRQVLTRFEAERSALARLDHPNITRIIDAGASQSGAPYFVMELVRGDSLTGYCDRHKLSIEQRVELVESVCHAVHHAHQKGILHRDIKPSNVMVTLHDGVAVPKVIDFGIAKALDRPLVEGTLFTRYGDMVGTPQYMSPEQAEESGLDLDVRTDIYSLGAVLFELLTGTPPIEKSTLDGKGVLGVLETVRDNDTENPSLRATRTLARDEKIASARGTDGHQLARLLKGELDWISMKALARDRSQRYESAAALGRDLRAYLDGGTVDAAAPSFLYQSRKLFQRHRSAGVAVITSLLMMLVVTLVSFSWAISNNRLKEIATGRAHQLNQKNQQLEEQGAELRTTLQRAKSAEQKALLLVNEKKEQAALERAMRRHFFKMLTALDIGGGKLDGDLSTAKRDEMSGLATDILTVVQSAMDRVAEANSELQIFGSENNVLESGAVGNSDSGAVTELVFEAQSNFSVLPNSDKLPSGLFDQAQIKKFQLKLDEGVFQTPTTSEYEGLGTLSPQVKYTMAYNPGQLGGLIIEEFRAEFGESHQKVAEALVHIARIELSADQIDSEILESRLREAIAIVKNGETQQAVVTGLESRILLSQFLHRTQRPAEAQRQLEQAGLDLKSKSSSLSESQQNIFGEKIEGLKELLASQDNS